MAECRYKGWCRIEYDTDFDVCYPCIGDGSETCAEYEPMPDVKALLKLADEIEDNDVTYCVSTQYVLDDYARRIREACGATQDD